MNELEFLKKYLKNLRGFNNIIEGFTSQDIKYFMAEYRINGFMRNALMMEPENDFSDRTKELIKYIFEYLTGILGSKIKIELYRIYGVLLRFISQLEDRILELQLRLIN